MDRLENDQIFYSVLFSFFSHNIKMRAIILMKGMQPLLSDFININFNCGE